MVIKETRSEKRRRENEMCAKIGDPKRITIKKEVKTIRQKRQ